MRDPEDAFKDLPEISQRSPISPGAHGARVGGRRRACSVHEELSRSYELNIYPAPGPCYSLENRGARGADGNIYTNWLGFIRDIGLLLPGAGNVMLERFTATSLASVAPVQQRGGTVSAVSQQQVRVGRERHTSACPAARARKRTRPCPVGG